MVEAPAVEVVRGLPALERLRDAWIALEGRGGDPDFFQSFAWSMQVAEARVRAEGQRYEPMAAVARRGNEIVALWPLALIRRIGQNELRNIDDPFGQLGGLLAIDEAAGAALVAGFLKIAKASSLAHAACFERVIEGSILSRALLAAGARQRGVVDAPYVTLGEHPTFMALKRSRSKKLMRNMRTSLNRLNRAGEIESRMVRDAAGVLEIGRMTLANRQQWLSATGRTAPAFRVGGFSDVLLGESRWGLAEMRVGLELRVSGGSIAQQLGFMHGGRYYAYLSGMDWAHKDLRPGAVHLAMVLEATMAAGSTVAELLTPASDYKMIWTDDVHRLSDLALPLSLAGRIKQSVWDERLRPALKATYHATPAPLRRAVNGLAHFGRTAERPTREHDAKP